MIFCHGTCLLLRHTSGCWDRTVFFLVDIGRCCAQSVSSPGLPRARSLKIIEDLFIKNGYPSHLVARLKNEVLRRNTGGRREPDRSGPAPVYLTLPFVDDDLCRRTEGIVRGSQLNLRIAWKGDPSLKSKLVRSAYLPVPCPGAGRHCNCCEAVLRGKCHTKNAVYRMDCTLCTKDESFYVDETRRSVRLRYNEHFRDKKKNRYSLRSPPNQTLSIYAIYEASLLEVLR